VTTHAIKLSGCTPEPLMSYLKALGVFRLVAEQADPAAALSWRGGVARLHSTLDRDELIGFFVEQYKPTPIVAPWNGGSGFYGGGSAPLEAIAGSDVERLRLYRDTIGRIRQFVPESKPTDDDKEALLIRCRSELADEVVPWLDVCFVLGEARVTFFPLLGTGGNDGRLDFTNNFMQRLAEVTPLRADTAPLSQSPSLLSAAIFADKLVSLGKTAIGQFNPGGIGGANGTQGGFEANSRVNAWDFVLMIEGALLFAGSAARRLGVGSSLRAVFPFSVESVAVGYGSATASEETTDGSRAELWLPLWDEFCTLAEVRHLFAEGRAQLGRRQARNSVEFALAVNLLGVNRGVKSFARYGFLKRNGLAFLATPLGRLTVELRPKARLLNDPPITEWLERWRRACSDKEKTPARYQSALRQIDRSMFAFANRSEHGNDEQLLAGRLDRTGERRADVVARLAVRGG
jgi:CRISPR-associated protein Csx17